MARSRAPARELPQDVTLCGWCSEHEDAAKRTAEFAEENERLRREVIALTNGEVHRELARSNADLRSQIIECQTKLRQARRDAAIAQGTCPLCGWQPSAKKLRKADYPGMAEELRRSVRGHALRVHRISGGRV